MARQRGGAEVVSSACDDRSRLTMQNSTMAEGHRLAVVVHLFYEDQWPEFVLALANIEHDFTLFVSLRPESEFADQIRVSFPHAILKPCPNVGRDVAPFLAWLPELQGFDLVCKIHTKRSDGRHSVWRKMVLGGLLGSPLIVNDYLAAFACDRDLAMAGPKFSYVDGAGHVTVLHRALTVQHGKLPKGWGFFAGTMFWCRPQVFAGLDSIYPQDCFVAHSDTDGHPEHVIERSFGVIVMQAQQKIMLHDSDILLDYPQNLRGNPNWGDTYNAFVAPPDHRPTAPSQMGDALSAAGLDRIFQDLRDAPVRVLEMGGQKAGELETWAQYFTQGRIFVACGHDENLNPPLFSDSRLRAIRADAAAPLTKTQILRHCAEFDIIRDRGGVGTRAQITAFLAYFPILAEGGIYLVETLADNPATRQDDPDLSAAAFFRNLSDAIIAAPRSGQFWTDPFVAAYDLEMDNTSLIAIDSIEYRHGLVVLRKVGAQNSALGPKAQPAPLAAQDKKETLLAENPHVLALMAKGQAFAALAQATQSLLETGESFAALATLAQIENHLGFLTRAKRSWQRALLIQPKAAAYAGLGAVLVQNGDTQAGISAFEAALNLDPDNTALLTSIAVAYLYLQDVTAAQGYAAQALHHDPSYPDALLCQARAEFMLGNVPLAKQNIAALHQSGFKKHEVLLLQVDLLSHEDAHEAALVLAAELCDAYPTAPECLITFRRAFRALQTIPARYETFLAALETPWTPATALKSKSLAPSDPVRIDVIIPIHNALRQVLSCLETVLAHSGARLGKLILVNDGSTAETVKALTDYASDDIILLHTPRQSGFTSAVLHGLSASDAPVFVVLNSDTLVPLGWLDRLYGALRATAKTAMVSPLSNNAAWQNYGPVFTDRQTLHSTAIPDQAERGRLEDIARDMGQATLAALPILHGFCLMVDRAAYEAVGGFDLHAYPEGYGETQDLSLRMRQRGYDLWVVTDCIVYHERGGSISQKRRENLTQSARESLYATYTALTYLCLEMACCQDKVLNQSRKAYVNPQG